MSEEAARNELAAIRLFLRIPDAESVMAHLRKMQACDVPGCVRRAGHPAFHVTHDQIAKREDGL